MKTLQKIVFPSTSLLFVLVKRTLTFVLVKIVKKKLANSKIIFCIFGAKLRHSRIRIHINEYGSATLVNAKQKKMGGPQLSSANCKSANMRNFIICSVCGPSANVTLCELRPNLFCDLRT